MTVKVAIYLFYKNCGLQFEIQLVCENIQFVYQSGMYFVERYLD